MHLDHPHGVLRVKSAAAAGDRVGREGPGEQNQRSVLNANSVSSQGHSRGFLYFIFVFDPVTMGSFRFVLFCLCSGGGIGVQSLPTEVRLEIP